MYKVKIIESVEKKLSKLDKTTLRIIKNWVIKNLVDTDNPKKVGKQLKGNLKGVWRYRIGDYRLFAKIDDEILTIFLIDIGHRREVYR